jgi:hypothetical protein
MVEQKERVSADTLEVAVLGCSFLLTVHWTLGTVHIQDHPTVLGMGHGPLHPLGIYSYQPLQVVLLGQQLPAHLTGTGSLALRALPSHDDSHSRVLGKARCVIGVVVAGQAAVVRLS